MKTALIIITSILSLGAAPCMAMDDFYKRMMGGAPKEPDMGPGLQIKVGNLRPPPRVRAVHLNIGGRTRMDNLMIRQNDDIEQLQDQLERQNDNIEQLQDKLDDLN